MQALLLIDIQNDYFEGGANSLVGSEEACSKAKKVLDYFRNSKLPVIHIQHISLNKNSSFFIEGTAGSMINKQLQPIAGEKLIIKHSPNSFKDTELQENLKKIAVTELVICGMMTHMCVDSTVRAASEHGYKITLIADGCATKDLILDGKITKSNMVQAAFLSALHGTFAEVVTTDHFLIPK